MIVYISIGNSDDKLSQREWHNFYVATSWLIHRSAETVHGQWVSEPAAAWQNACWCVEINPSMGDWLRDRLATLASDHRQDSIAWTPSGETEFLGPVGTPQKSWAPVAENE